MVGPVTGGKFCRERGRENTLETHQINDTKGSRYAEDESVQSENISLTIEEG